MLLYLFKVIFFAVAVSCIGYSNVLAEFPTWFVNPPLERYPNKVYFTSSAQSNEGFDHAIEKALAGISRQIRAQVQENSVYIRSQVGEDSQALSSFFSMSEISSNVDLQNYEVAQREQTSQGYFVMLALNKPRMIASLKLNVSGANTSIYESYKIGKKLYKEGDLEESITTFLSANQYYPVVFAGYDLLNALGAADETDKPVKSWNEILAEIIKSVKGIQIETNNSEFELVSVGETINMKAFITNLHRNPVRNIRLAFFRESEIIPFYSGYSDEKGIVETSFPAQFSGRGYNRIVIKAISTFQDEQVQALVNSLEANYRYMTKVGELKPVAINVNSTGIPDMKKGALLNSVKELFISNGLNVSDDSNDKIVVEVEGRETDGLSQRIKRVQLTISGIVIFDDNQVAGFSSSVAGTGRTTSDAFDSAIKGFRVSDDDIRKIISYISN